MPFADSAYSAQKICDRMVENDIKDRVQRKGYRNRTFKPKLTAIDTGCRQLLVDRLQVLERRFNTV